MSPDIDTHPQYWGYPILLKYVLIVVWGKRADVALGSRRAIYSKSKDKNSKNGDYPLSASQRKGQYRKILLNKSSIYHLVWGGSHCH